MLWCSGCCVDKSQHPINNLVEAHCYGIGRTGQIFEQSRSSEETDRNVDVSTAKVFVSTMLTKTFAVEMSTFLSVSSLLRDCSKICPVLPHKYHLHFQQKPYYTRTTATSSLLPVSVVLNSHVYTLPIHTNDMKMSIIDTAFSQVIW